MAPYLLQTKIRTPLKLPALPVAFLTLLPSCLQHFSRLFQTLPCPSCNLSQVYRYLGPLYLSFCLEVYLPQCQIIDLFYHDLLPPLSSIKFLIIKSFLTDLLKLQLFFSLWLPAHPSPIFFLFPD